MLIPGMIRRGVIFVGFVLLANSAAMAQFVSARESRSDLAELTERRGPSARHYRVADGKLVAVIAAVPTDFRTEGGSWQRIRPRTSAAADGSSVALENAIQVQSRNGGITITDRKGRGLTWLLPHEAEVRNDGVEVDVAGTHWSYTLTRYGIKAETVVPKPRGPQTYRFPFALEGDPGEIEIDSGGGL